MLSTPITFGLVIKEKPSRISNIESYGQTHYVGGNGYGNYTKIQQAINNASSGDTIYVYNGTYTDYYPSGQWGYTVFINKSINLIGENKYNTIINGTNQGIVVRVAAHSVSISGFTIQNSGGALYGGIKIMDYYGKTTIFNNILRNNSAGIYIFLNDQVTIRNNIIEDNQNGILFFDGKRCLIENNLIANNSNGISLVYGDYGGITPDSIIIDNIIRDNNIGIVAENTRFNIRFNNFINNQKQTTVRKGVYISSLPLLLKLRNQWYKNYWDNWKYSLPKPVIGLTVICIQGIRIDFPIMIFPSIEIDRYPHQSPYDIGV